MYICMCLYGFLNVFMCVCVCVCVCVFLYGFVNVSVYVCVCVILSQCVSVFMCVRPCTLRPDDHDDPLPPKETQTHQLISGTYQKHLKKPETEMRSLMRLN